jgi:predicted ABC-type sugar transport system permease subunit
MIDYLNKRLESGPTDARIMAIGGNVQVALKVKIESVDQVGMVCRTYGMLGGLGEPMLRPWACVAHVSFD